MKTVVKCADIEPWAEADRALADMAALTDDQFVLSGGGFALHCTRIGCAIPDRTRLSAEQLHQGRGEVHIIVQAVVDLSLDAIGPTNDHGDITGALIGGCVFTVYAEFAHILTVIR